MKRTGMLISIFISGWLALSLSNIKTALADPSDPFTGSSPSFDSAPEEPGSYNVGDWGVAEQNGAATYTYSIDLPPGRNEMAPSLVLRYSSQSPLRGGIAAGWTLDIPAIRIDTSLGTERKKYYKASLGSTSGRLVEVPDESPYPGKAYRINFDKSFTRFFHSKPGEFDPAPRGWVAFTPDGVKHFFEHGLRASDNLTRWHITSQVDPFGNTVRYFWSEVEAPNAVGLRPRIDWSLERIEYTSNEAANLEAHAKIEFEYEPLEVCSFSNVPIGSSSRPLPPEQVEGARRLKALKIFVRAEQGQAWRVRKTISLEYELHSALLGQPLFPDPPPPDIFCPQNMVRYLTQINVLAFAPDGTATSLPPITFKYNNRFQIFHLSGQTIPTPGPGHYGNTDGAIGTLLDVDSDGLSDRVHVEEEAGVCTLVWQKGLLGGEFETTKRKSPLPTVPWYEEWKGKPEPQRVRDERCTLNGQVAYRDRNIIGGLQLTKGVVSYHFLDYTGDGRLDLLTNVWAAGNHPTYVAALTNIISGVVTDDNDDPFPNELPPRMTPERDSHFVWRVFQNAADPKGGIPSPNPDSVFSTNNPITVRSPRPLPPSASDENLDLSSAPIFSIPPLTDIDGDGFLDVIDVTHGNNSNILGATDWRVYLGNGGPDFPELIDAITWQVPRFAMAFSGNGFDEEGGICGNIFFKSAKRTIAGLEDINGNGLPDLVVQIDDLRLKAYRNSGIGFQSVPIDLGNPQPLERVQTDIECPVPGSVQLKDGNRGYRRRIIDLDGDGLKDIIIFSGNEDDITAEHNVFVRSGLGDRLGPPFQIASGWQKVKRLLAAKDGNWQLNTDFTDITGDGLADLVH